MMGGTIHSRQVMMKFLVISLLSLSQASSLHGMTKQKLVPTLTTPTTPIDVTRSNGLQLPPAVLDQVPSIHNALEQTGDHDTEHVDSLYNDVICSVDYLPFSDLETIRLALTIAYLCHFEQKRASGEKYIIHPVAVAAILAESKADCESLVSGLLHDTVEDSDMTIQEIQAVFGPQVGQIVKGVTNVDVFTKSRMEQIPSIEEDTNKRAIKNENLRNMFISMAEDWRVILVKLADRLHNMRTLGHLSHDRQIKMAKETLDIYSPLAHRLGAWKMVTELEDLSFKYLYPNDHGRIKSQIDTRHIMYGGLLSHIKETMHRQLYGLGFSCNIECRLKSVYSTWKKTKRYHCGVDQIKDLVAVRIILNTQDDQSASETCYKVLSKLHENWQAVPRSIKDYVNLPKQNGYQSLHTVLMIHDDLPLEVQIRTPKMHQIAEFGTAAHWLYKSDEHSLSWLQVVKQWNGKVNTTADFLGLVRDRLLSNRVFVVGPNGAVLDLKKGTTLLEAVHVHLLFLDRANRDVTVNSIRQASSYRLKNGDGIGFVDRA